MKQTTFQIKMTVTCKKPCKYVENMQATGYDGDLICLECLISEHLEGQEEFGSLEIAKSDGHVLIAQRGG